MRWRPHLLLGLLLQTGPSTDRRHLVSGYPRYNSSPVSSSRSTENRGLVCADGCGFHRRGNVVVVVVFRRCGLPTFGSPHLAPYVHLVNSHTIHGAIPAVRLHNAPHSSFLSGFRKNQRENVHVIGDERGDSLRVKTNSTAEKRAKHRGRIVNDATSIGRVRSRPQ